MATTTGHDPNPEFQDAMRRIEERIFGREPRWTYFYCGHPGCAWMFGWTTERMGDGKFAAFIHRPIWKGARNRRTARHWKKVRETHFAKRSTAKARAIQYEQAHRRSAH